LKKWTLLEEIATPDGSTLSLSVHDATFVLRVNGRELMSTRHSFSEQQLGVVACQPLAARKGACVLIGGLGLGITLRAALANLARDAQVIVAELLPEVVAWNRNLAYPLASAELADPRTQIAIGDVARVIEQSEARFDAILLDADNETTVMNTAGNSRLYQAAGLAAVRRALKPAGSAVYWSAGDDPSFVERFASCGFDVTTQKVRRHPASRSSHFLFVGHRSEVRR
jgi:spermidine synthase